MKTPGFFKEIFIKFTLNIGNLAKAKLLMIIDIPTFELINLQSVLDNIIRVNKKSPN